MLNNQFLERIFAHPEMRKIPVGMQASEIKVFEDVLADMRLVAAPLSVNGKAEAGSKKS